MRKRIFVLFGILLIFSTMFIPVFADTPSAGSICYSTMQFDYVFCDGVMYPWPGNSFILGIENSFDDFNVDSYGSTVSVDFKSDFNDLTFYASNFLLTNESVGVFSSVYSNVLFDSLEVTGKVITTKRDSVSSKYITQSESFSLSTSVSGVSSIDLGRLLRNKFAGNLVSGPVYITDLSVRITAHSTLNSDLYINFKSSVIPSNFSYASWVNSRGFLTEIVYEDGSGLNFEWLLNIVNAFLEFQITPELTINSIFKIVIVVGIFFWVLTLTI